MGIEVRAVASGDAGALVAFVERIPEGHRTFLKQVDLSPEAVGRWATDTSSRRSVAVDGETIAGIVAISPGAGWSSHVGELLLVVDPAYRRQGVGTALARQGLLTALDMRLAKVFVEVMATNEGAVAMFRGLGFEPEALLVDQVHDGTGALQDLVVLSHRVDDSWSAMITSGLDEAIG